jgi:hypothetical protein
VLCYECSKVGRNQHAIGLCHHCSAALCREHSRIVADPVTATYPIAKTVVLPLQARLFLCETCLAALEQAHPGTRRPERLDAPVAATGLIR